MIRELTYFPYYEYADGPEGEGWDDAFDYEVGVP